jgi:peptidyl-prolyl cis-trans isomerase D
MKRFLGIIPLTVLILFVSCQKEPGNVTVKEPDRVTVQHILISFKGSISKETVTRTREEAEKLAFEIFERAKKGEDFDALVKEFTDDQHPGIYKMSNFDVEPQADQEEYPRNGMVKSFGDVSFKLPVNGIGLAEYDPDNSKYGWHIIKRLQ